jgi:hypothetical protein
MPLAEYSTQEPIPVQETIQTQQQRPEANRYYTPILVEVYEDTRLRRVKWFSDLQLAHMWCMEEVTSYPEEDWITVHRCFPDFADAMDARWLLGHSGKRAAYSDYYEYRVCYEPVDSELLRNEGIDE